MYTTTSTNNQQVTPNIESPIVSELNKINIKLEHLSKVLEPVRCSVPSNVSEKEQNSAPLISELRKINGKLANLLDSIVL